ncbi:MAG: hypothetical protein ACKPCM_01715, partial [Pseudanabaena sp.]
MSMYSFENRYTMTWMEQISDLQAYKEVHTVFLRKAMISLGIGIAIATFATTNAFFMAVSIK